MLLLHVLHRNTYSVNLVLHVNDANSNDSTELFESEEDGSQRFFGCQTIRWAEFAGDSADEHR